MELKNKLQGGEENRVGILVKKVIDMVVDWFKPKQRSRVTFFAKGKKISFLSRKKKW